MGLETVYVIGGLILLILGGDWLLNAAVGMSLRMNIPKIVIGMTIVSFATSMPELIVSLNAALSGHADIAMGNVIGSNIANIGLVLGITTLISTIKVTDSFHKTDWPMMMFSSLLLYFFISNDGQLVRYEGIILLLLLLVFLIYLFKFRKQDLIEEEEVEEKDFLSNSKIGFLLLIGATALWAGSELLVKGAISLAEKFGVSDRIISITVVSVGTSIPELAASILAVIKKEKAISLGNLLGSNIFNICAVLGITSIVTPISVAEEFLTKDIFWMLGIAFMVLLLVLFPIRMKLSKYEGAILLSSYLLFLYFTITA